MTDEQQSALLRALAGMGEFAFYPEDLEFEPAKALFNGPRKIFDACADAIAKSNDTAQAVPFTYLSNSSLNARAFRSAGHHFIGINWGTVVLLHDIFYRMLAVPMVFPEIGDPDAESRFDPLPRLPIDARDLPYNEGIPFGLTICPQDPVRALYAHYLAQVALDFIYIHEHQHVVGGHLQYLKGDHRSMAAIEAEPSVGDLMTFFVLELEADAAAANFSLGIACDRKGNAWRVPAPLAPYMTTAKLRWRAWLFAVHTLFLIMEEATYRVSKPKATVTDVHPTAVLRRGTLANLVFARRSDFRNPEVAFKMGVAACLDAHQAMRAVIDGRDRLILAVDVFGPQRDTGERMLAKRWLTMRPELETLAAKNGANTAPEDLIMILAAERWSQIWKTGLRR
jgi:hypothetical protein